MLGIWYSGIWIVVSILLLLIVVNWIRIKGFRGFYQEVRVFFSGHFQDCTGDRWHLRFIHLNPPRLRVDMNPGLIVWCENDKKWSYTLQDKSQKQKLFLCFRRCFISIPFGNETWMCELDHDTLQAKEEPRRLLNDPKLEDARLFTYDGQLYAACSKIMNFQILTKQVAMKLHLNQPDLNPVEIYSPLNDFLSKNKMEKNWQFFEFNHKKYVVYSIHPFKIYELSMDNLKPLDVKTEQKWNAENGVKLRCSTPPVWIGDRFYMVVHSKDYRMYVVTFDALFNLIGYTPSAIIDCPGHYIYFPCGFVYDRRKQSFLIATGVNNKQVAILEIHKSVIDESMKNIQVLQGA